MTAGMAGFSVTGSLGGSCTWGQKAQDTCAVLAFVWGCHDDCGADGSPDGVGGELNGVDQPSSVGFLRTIGYVRNRGYLLLLGDLPESNKRTSLVVLRECDHDG